MLQEAEELFAEPATGIQIALRDRFCAPGRVTNFGAVYITDAPLPAEAETG